MQKKKHLHCFLELGSCFLGYQEGQWGSCQGSCHCTSCLGHTDCPRKDEILNKWEIGNYMKEPMTQILMHLIDI